MTYPEQGVHIPGTQKAEQLIGTDRRNLMLNPRMTFFTTSCNFCAMIGLVKGLNPPSMNVMTVSSSDDGQPETSSGNLPRSSVNEALVNDERVGLPCC